METVLLLYGITGSKKEDILKMKESGVSRSYVDGSKYMWFELRKRYSNPSRFVAIGVWR